MSDKEIKLDEEIQRCYIEGWYGIDDDCECDEPDNSTFRYGSDDIKDN